MPLIMESSSCPSAYPDDLEGHICPVPIYGMLPSKIADHAIAGRLKELSDWISKGGDINASDELGQTLLHIACQEEQAEVLRWLLQHPDIHLNPRKMGQTPLGIAASLENTNILEILLSGTGSKRCVLNLSCLTERGQKNVRTTAIIVATCNQRWPAVELLLQHYQDIREWEAFNIFLKAIEDYQYEIAETVINLNFSFKDYDFSGHIKEVYQNKRWSLLEAILTKNFHHNNDSSLKVLQVICVKQDWEKMEKFLRLLNGGETKIHARLVTDVLERNRTEVEEMLKTVRNDREVMTGTLLVASVGGTSEDLAEVLVKGSSEEVHYSDQTLDNALLLASLFHNVEFLQNLLLIKRFSLKILLRSHSACKVPCRTDVLMLMAKIIEDRIKEFLVVKSEGKEQLNK